MKCNQGNRQPKGFSDLQGVRAIDEGSGSLRARYMTPLGEWLLQQGKATEAGKEIVLGAASLLEPVPISLPKGRVCLRRKTLYPFSMCNYSTKHSLVWRFCSAWACEYKTTVPGCYRMTQDTER